MAIVTLDEAKSHLNVTDDADDDLISAKIDAATAFTVAALGDDPEANTGGPTDDIVEAVLQLVAHLYENREATLVGLTPAELPLGFWDIVNARRNYTF